MVRGPVASARRRAQQKLSRWKNVKGNLCDAYFDYHVREAKSFVEAER